MNSLFQDQLVADLNKVFLNLNEFAEMHNINGIEVSCIIDTDSTQPLRAGIAKYDGTFKETIMLFISESNLPNEPKPAYNQRIIVDKHNYRIMHVDLNNSLYEILLEAIK